MIILFDAPYTLFKRLLSLFTVLKLEQLVYAMNFSLISIWYIHPMRIKLYIHPQYAFIGLENENQCVFTVYTFPNHIVNGDQYEFTIFLPWPIVNENHCTINSKINCTPKGVYWPILRLHSSLAVIARINLLSWASKFATDKIKCSFEMGK